MWGGGVRNVKFHNCKKNICLHTRPLYESIKYIIFFKIVHYFG